MNKKKVIMYWSINIVLYITVIVLTIITGGTTIVCILGWLLSTILTGLIIYLQCRLIDKQKIIDDLNKEWLKSIKDWKAVIEAKDKYIDWLIKNNDIKF